MKKIYIVALLIVGVIVLLTRFWTKTLVPTEMHIKDSIRHYFPIVQGDELSITCEIFNDGEEDLAITDIQPSNFAITMDTSMPGIIPSGKSEILHFTFHSDKNIGFSQHVIRFFGNIKEEGMDSLVFDVHIVRPTLDGSDYEEIYYHTKQDEINLLVDGEKGQKSYWIDGDTDIDSSYIHSYNNELYMDW